LIYKVEQPSLKPLKEKILSDFNLSQDQREWTGATADRHVFTEVQRILPDRAGTPD